MAEPEGRAGVKRLVLEGTAVTHGGLKVLQRMTGLPVLVLSTPLVGDPGVDCLKGLTDLREISLGGCRMSARGISELTQALPKARIIQ